MIFKKSILTFLFLTHITMFYSFAQEWKVPERNKKKTAPAKFTSENIKKGETLFNMNCVACHGNPGKGNFAKINPSPGDPASEKYQGNTDGDIFYKMTNGRLPMPSFKNTITEEDRWNIIAFVRSFNNKYIQPEPNKEIITDYTVSLEVSQIKEKNEIFVKATATSKISPVPVAVKGADVTLYVQRRFGILPIDKKRTTNNKGEISFAFPSDLPGDTAGIVNILVKLSDETGDYGEAETSVKLPAGKPTKADNLLDTRAMWSVRSQAPVWLIVSYCSSVLVVLGFITYIIMQLIKLRKLGTKSINKSEYE